MVLTILAIDDPKTEKDIEKLDKINSSYSKSIEPKVDKKLDNLDYLSVNTNKKVNVGFSE